MRVFAAVLAIFAASALAFADVPVQFYDAQGNLITGSSVDVIAVDPNTRQMTRTTLPADPDGTYSVPANPGDEVRFELHDDTPRLGRASQVVLKVPKGLQAPLVVTLGPQGEELPSNDECTDPWRVTVGSVTVDTTVGATHDGVPFCGTTNTAPGVWFVVSGGGLTTLTASTCEMVGNPPGSAGFDTKISVYCQDCSALSCVAGNDDSPGCNFHSAVSWCSEPGAHYRILVHGFGAATGEFALSVSSNGEYCVPTTSCLFGFPRACCLVGQPPFEQGELALGCYGVELEGQCDGVLLGPGMTCNVITGQADYVATPELAIPDNLAAGVSSTIGVPEGFTVTELGVDIGINHTSISDLIIRVTGPTGLSQVIWNQVCGSTDDINATADDDGTETFCAPINAGPIDSVFFPPALAGDGPLSVFDGTQAQGNWTINVSDNVPAETGTLKQWSLHFVQIASACPSPDCPPPAGAGTTEGSLGAGGCPVDEDEDDEG